MPTNARQFAVRLRNFHAKTEQQAVAVHQKAGLMALDGCIRMSPVDTGYFRVNWNGAVGTADLSVAEPGREDYPAPSAGDRAASFGSLQLGQTIVVSNNTEYAEELNNGSSNQAPAGIIGVVVARLQAAFG